MKAKSCFHCCYWQCDIEIDDGNLAPFRLGRCNLYDELEDASPAFVEGPDTDNHYFATRDWFGCFMFQPRHEGTP